MGIYEFSSEVGDDKVIPDHIHLGSVSTLELQMGHLQRVFAYIGVYALHGALPSDIDFFGPN